MADENAAPPKGCGCWDDYTDAHAVACIAWQARLKVAIARRMAEDEEFRKEMEILWAKHPAILVLPGAPYFDEPQPAKDL